MAPAKSITILDGGMSRELMRLGAPFRQPEWSALALIEAPEYVGRAHSEFLDAGAEVITTNSYALVPFHIGEDRFRQQGAALAALAGKQARDAADKKLAAAAAAGTTRKVLVAGSLPPIFGSYEPQNFDPLRVREYLDVLVDAMAPYVDVWLGETLSLIAEAEAVEAAVRHTGRPLWMAFTVDDQCVDGLSALRSGETVEKAVQWALKSTSEAILFNCSSPEYLSSSVKVAAQTILDYVPDNEKNSRTLAVGAYGNAFSKSAREQSANEGVSTLRDDLSPQEYAAFARQWVEDGATIIGGCCGIGCDHIAELASEFKGKP